MHASTLLMTCMLMFVGGGSAGTAGGIKVTTFAVLAVAIIAEVRGEPNSAVLGRKLGPHVLRQALTVALLGVGLVMTATLALLSTTSLPFEQVLFEVVSAFATVGLSTGITADFPAAGQLILILLMFIGRLGPVTLVSALALRERKRLMFIGRLGPVTLVSALALRERKRRYDLPEERPVIG